MKNEWKIKNEWRREHALEGLSHAKMYTRNELFEEAGSRIYTVFSILLIKDWAIYTNNSLYIK